MRFSTSVSIHYSSLSGPLTNGLKYFWFWLRFHVVIQILSLKNLTRQGMILYFGEIDSPGYHTPGRSNSLGMIPWGDWPAGYDTLGRLTHGVMIPGGYWLAGVWYPGEIDLPGYDTTGTGLGIRSFQENATF